MEAEIDSGSQDAIVMRNLVKKYRVKKRDNQSKKREITALDQLSLSIRRGEIYGLIGQNGAGKTTTLKILSGLILPDKGECTVLGHDVVKEVGTVRKEIGVSVGEFTRALYWRLSGLENLLFFAKLRGIKKPKRRAMELVRLMDLEKWKDEKVMRYSTGMKHKLSIAIALLHNPPVLFLDEPLTGIDPVSAHQIKKFIREELSDKTIIWTSHNLFEIEEMCNRIGLLKRGKLILEGKAEDLKKAYWNYEKLIIKTSTPESFLELDGSSRTSTGVLIETNNLNKTMKHLGGILAHGAEVEEISTIRPTLEDIFMHEIEEGETDNRGNKNIERGKHEESANNG